MAVTYTFDQCNVDKTYTVVDPTKKPGRGIIEIYVRHVDFSKIYTQTGDTAAHSDILQLFTIKKGYTVVMAGVGMDTVTTAAAKASIGLNAGAAWFTSVVDLDDLSLPASTAGAQKGGQSNRGALDTLDLLEASAAQTLAGGKGLAVAIVIHTGDLHRHVYPT